MSLGVPFMTYLLYFGCSEQWGGCPPPLNILGKLLKDSILDVSNWSKLWDTQAAVLYLGWYAFCVVAWFILPGDWVEGSQMRNGKKMSYKINGAAFMLLDDCVVTERELSAFSTFLLAIGLTAGHIYSSGPASFTFIYEKFVGLITAATIMAVLQATYCYASSFREGKLLALGGNSGNFIYDVRLSHRAR